MRKTVVLTLETEKPVELPEQVEADGDIAIMLAMVIHAAGIAKQWKDAARAEVPRWRPIS